jgi:thiol-disulfide isomerase/thioredoxin
MGSRGARFVVLAVAVVLAFMAPVAAAAQDVGLPLGTKPPATVIEDLNGDSVNLDDYIGKKPVLMEFWATWCPLCRAMEPRLRAAHERFGDNVQFLFIGVAVNQTPRSIRRHLAKDPLPGRVLWDDDGAAVRAFDAPTTSYIVILDRSGKVTYTGSGSDQDVEAALAKVAVPVGSGRQH